METFVIRIYERDKLDPDTLIGTVEGPGRGEGEVFTSLDELIGFIVAAGMGRPLPLDGNKGTRARPRLN